MLPSGLVPTTLRGNLIIFFWICFLWTVPLCWAGGEGFSLELKDPSSEEVILRIPLHLDETFTIRYIHSVDHTPVFEVFELDQEGNLVLQSTYFKMFGAGMGHWEGRGVVAFDGRWTWIKDIHETLGSFVLRVGGTTVDHTILYRDQEIHLSEKWAERRLLVSVAKSPP